MTIENLQPVTYAIISIAFVVGTCSFLLRLYSRMAIMHSFGVDDVGAIFLMFVNAGQQAVLYMFLHYGCGKHAATLSSEELEQITKWLFIEEIYYMFTHWSIKMGFLLFYLRLSQEKTFRLAVYGTMALNTIFTVVNWIVAILQCTPFDAIFHRALYPEAKCINTWLTLMLPSVLNITTDIIILAIPIRTVLGLQMSIRRKVAVLGVIGFGFSAVIVAGFRFLILYQLGTSADTSYVLGDMVVVAAIEIELAVVAVNLPGMKALYNKVSGGGSSADGSHGKPSGGVSAEGAYRLGSMSGTGRSGRRAGPITMQLDELGNESEEELWRKQRGEIEVTTEVSVTQGMDADAGSRKPLGHIEGIDE